MSQTFPFPRRSLTSRSRLVIVGCGGYIGSHLLENILADPTVHVDGWDPRTEKIEHLVDAPNLSLRRTDLSEPHDLGDLAAAIDEADAVINLAAICTPSQYNTDPVTVIRANFLDTYKIVDLCAERGKWLIHFSTSEVYGRTIASYFPGNTYDDPRLYELDEDDTPLVMGPIRKQRWTYGCAKQLLERYIYAHHKQSDLSFTIVRPLNFFGARMDFIPGRDGEGVPRVLACFMSALLDGMPLQLVDGGRASRTIVSIRDAIRAIVLMLEKPERAVNQTFNIGNRENEITIAGLATLMRRLFAEITGNDSYLEHPIEFVSAVNFYGEGYEDCDRRMPRVDRAEERLGWKAEISLEETLRDAMGYYYKKYGPGQHTTP